MDTLRTYGTKGIACDIASWLLYVAMNVFMPMQWGRV